MIGRLLCRIGWHRMSYPQVITRWGGPKHRGAETLESRCLRECGHAIHFTAFPLFTAGVTEDHQ